MKKYTALSFVVLCLAIAQPASARSTFTIVEGWNLVSTQVAEDLFQDRNGFDELLQNGAALFGLSTTDKKYYGGSGSLKSVEEKLQQMFRSMSDGDDGVASFGWWVYSPRSIPLSIDFDIPADSKKRTEESYHFSKGWNLIGVTSLMLNKSITEVRGSCTFAAVYVFEKGQWHKQSEHDLGEKLTEDALGMAFAAKVSNDCTFEFKKKVITPQVPGLPE